MSRNWKGKKAIDTRLVPPWSWVSLVGAVAGVLKSRSVKCDFTDVAGMSGYAFIVNIHPGLCPSGPTAFDWMMLQEGIRTLGLDTEVVMAEHDEHTDDEELCTELFEKVREEIDAGRCCVVWGATDVPEFAIAYGYRDDSYLVRSYRSARHRDGQEWKEGLGPGDSPEEPVRYDKLNAPGCLAAVFFGDRVESEQVRADRQAIARAVQLLGDRHVCFDPSYFHGAGAFGKWAEVLEAGEAGPSGNAYNVVCWWEMQMLASGFCLRLAKRRPEAGEKLKQAGDLFRESFEDLEWLKGKFPFPMGGGPVDEGAAKEAARLLRECRRLNQDAAGALEQALALM